MGKGQGGEDERLKRHLIVESTRNGCQMKVAKPSYIIVDLGERDWCFDFSPAIRAATDEFYSLLNRCGDSNYARELGRFVKKHPNHIDALYHRAECLLCDGKLVEGFRMSQAAVGIGYAAMPPRFKLGRDRLRTSFIQNRPFLRAIHGLMRAQYILRLDADAIQSAETALKLDPEDRNGFREWLVTFYLVQRRDQDALSLFESKAYKGTFFGSEYLHALALIRQRKFAPARSVLRECLRYRRYVAKYLLDSSLPKVPPSGFGMASGGEEEGCHYAGLFGALWRENPEAMKILAEEAAPDIARGWTVAN